MNVIEEEDRKIATFETLWWVALSGTLILSGGYLLFNGSQALGFCLVVASGYMMKYGKPLGRAFAQVQILFFIRLGTLTHKMAVSRAREVSEAAALAADTERKLAVTRKEVDKRLTLLDGKLVSYEAETDPARRPLHLKDAYDQITELSTKKASGEIPAYVLTEQELLNHAKATSNHFGRLHLAEDRLNQELLRIFNNFGVIESPDQMKARESAERLAKLKAQAESLGTKIKSQAKDFKSLLERTKDTITEQVRNRTTTGVTGVISRLAVVDTCLTRLEVEQDPSQRLELLEKAHKELMAMELQKASGKLAADVLGNPDLRAHATDTIAHLDRIGLSQDRLNFQIKRLFADVA